jgi:hypothetical protein
MDIPGDEPNTKSWQLSWRTAAITLPALLLLYFIRPWLHPFIIGVYRNPFIIQAVLIAALTAGFTWHTTRKTTVAYNTGLAVGAAFLLIGSFLNAPYQGVAMADDLEEQATATDTLPNVSVDHPRILPRSVASRYAQNSLQEPRHRLSDGDIAIAPDGTPQWSYALRPDGGLNTFIVKQKGAAFVNMSTSSSDITFDNDEMSVGVGTQITDNIHWQLRKSAYFVSYADPFVYQGTDALRIATPYIEYDYEFRFPILYTVPKWGGVAVTDQDGTTTYVDDADVASHNELSEQRTYPFSLARRYIASNKYRNGIINKWFFHEDQLEVAPVPGQGNDQPFMVLTEDNPELFVATEPYGDASGLFEIWTVDAVTGDYEQFALDRDQGLIGADKAVSFVRQANSRVTWASRGGDNGFTPIEPLPVVVNNTLYWQIRVVPVDSAGVAFTAFVNAKTSDVYTADDDEDIRRFLRGQPTKTNTSQPGSDEQEPGETVTIDVIEDGTVIEETTVNASNYSVSIQRN